MPDIIPAERYLHPVSTNLGKSGNHYHIQIIVQFNFSKAICVFSRRFKYTKKCRNYPFFYFLGVLGVSLS